MPVFARFTVRLAVVGAVAAIALTSGLASAVTPGGLTLVMSVDGGAPINIDPHGSDLGGGLFHYEGSLLSPQQWNLTWNLNADTDPFINGNLAVGNFSGATQIFDLLVSVPVTPTGPGFLMGGSAGLSFTATPGGGTVAPVVGTPGWQALVNGAPVASMYGTGSPGATLTLPSFGSLVSTQAFGTPVPSAPGPIGVTATSIGIHIHFSLTPGDLFSMTSVFSIAAVPGPGSLAVLGLGLLGRRRRRTA